MEQVALNNVQLDYLARDDPQLKPYFYGTVACDRLPTTPDKKTPGATRSARSTLVSPVHVPERV